MRTVRKVQMGHTWTTVAFNSLLAAYRFDVQNGGHGLALRRLWRNIKHWYRRNIR